MSVSKFKFVSPGIQVAEIDNSQLPRLPEEIGPVIIGRADRGPALRPVQVNSFSDFVEIFGLPEPGGRSDDVWRNGGTGLAPTYGVYAAQAYLRNSSPITFVRLLGAAHTDAVTDSGEAGWKVGGYTGSPNERQGGAFGLFVMPSGSAATETGILAAVFYTTTGSVVLRGESITSQTTSPTTLSGNCALVRSQSGKNWKMEIFEDQGATPTETISFNFTRTSKNYIRKVFNTNPALVNSTITSTDNVKTYFLGETFDKALGALTPSTEQIGVILPLALGSSGAITKQQGDQRRTLTNAETPWVFSQDLTANSGSDLQTITQDLFKFKTHNAGAWEAQNLKVSVTDIKASTNDADPYGTFSVEVRRAKDSDNAKQVVERFSRCNLNPLSVDYIGRKIGDSYVEWSDTDRRYREYGEYANQSKYIYVQVHSDVEAGGDPTYLPFGFYGPVKFTDASVTSGSAFPSNVFVQGSGSCPDATTTKNQSIPAGSADRGGVTFGVSSTLTTVNLQFPSASLRANTVDGNLASPKDAYFGIDTTRDGSTQFEESYADIVRAFPNSYDARGDVSNTEMVYSYIFSLEDVTRYTGSAAATTTLTDQSGQTSTTDAYYFSGSRAQGNSIAVTGSNTWNNVLDDGFNSFTVPLLGGSDGVDIREADPFNNADLADKTETTSYSFNSIKRAIDSVADPEVVEMNMLSMPGLTNSGLTDHVIKVCEDRADALGVIDVADAYTPAHEAYNASETNRRGTAEGVITAFNDRNFNTSYGCTFYPWVQIRDGETGRNLWAPPSIAAIGTFSSSQRKSELWFAPAGFTRGGLTEGAAGLTVTNVSEKLTSKQRDNLYEVNINPIASFPSEGIVMFGQKTLQATPSALDRINVRRLMIFVKKEVSRIASTLLFDQNVESTWNRFLGQAEPFLDSLVARLGLTDYRVILDETTTTPDLVDRNILYAKIFLKPARAIEFIALDFVITSTGAGFED